jgi:nitrogenase-stabilizing/protective protein
MTDAYDRLAGLTTAEEFFEVLQVPYDPAVLRVNRLHVLQRFRDYLAAYSEPDTATLQVCLAAAHRDFQRSTPQRERIFAVFRQDTDAAGRTFVPLDALSEPIPGD